MTIVVHTSTHNQSHHRRRPESPVQLILQQSTFRIANVNGIGEIDAIPPDVDLCWQKPNPSAKAAAAVVFGKKRRQRESPMTYTLHHDMTTVTPTRTLMSLQSTILAPARSALFLHHSVHFHRSFADMTLSVGARTMMTSQNAGGFKRH